MRKLIRVAVAVSFVAAFSTPHAASTMTLQAAPTNPDGSFKFADPDEQTEMLTGRAQESDPMASRLATPIVRPPEKWGAPCSAFSPGVAGEPCRNDTPKATGSK